jgi:hypothetical protein
MGTVKQSPSRSYVGGDGIMGKLAQEKRKALGDKYIGKHGNKLRRPNVGRKKRLEKKLRAGTGSMSGDAP